MSADSLLLPNPLDKVLLGIAPPDNGLGGRLVVRIPRGGCGNALMLIVFRIVFPAAFTPGVALNLGRVVLPPGVVGAERFECEGARSPLFGNRGGEVLSLASERVESFPVLFRVFVVGNAGNAVVGGPYEGLDGRGNAAAIMNIALVDQDGRTEDQTMIYNSRPRVVYQGEDTQASMKLGAWSPRCSKSWPGDESRWGSVPGTNSKIVQLSVEMIRWGVVLRTEAVVPKYLKRYSVQVNMPEQKTRCLNLNRVSALASKNSTNDRRANRYLSGRINHPH